MLGARRENLEHVSYPMAPSEVPTLKPYYAKSTPIVSKRVVEK